MFENFTSFSITTQKSPVEVTIHGIRAGSGPPLLLLHGFPQTHHIWRFIAPQLTSHFTIIAVDIRGYGASSKPAGVEHYVKSAMARDCMEVMSSLGFENYYVCAHDRGARVAHKLLVDYPERVIKAIFLDICPTLAMFEKTNQEFAMKYWHWFFLAQPYPLPEMTIAANPRGVLERFMGLRGEKGLSIFEGEAFEVYVRGMEDKDTRRGMCDDYRAAATLDLEEQREDLRLGRKIKNPLLVLWGKSGVIESLFDGVGEWKKVSDAEVSGESVQSGHYIPEEVPDVLVKHILDFFP